MLLEADSFILINTIVFSIIGFVIILVLIFSIVIIIKNIKPDLCKCCNQGDSQQDQVVNISSKTDKKKKESASGSKNNKVGQYLTLEEHLDTILDTPIKKVPVKKETHGYTLEFFPDDNTVVQIEGTSNKVCFIN